MLNIYLLRHGQTAWNADNNRYCGRTDIPLTEKGIEQAEAVEQQLWGVHFDGVYSSPLQRAAITAQIAADRAPVKDDRLIEVDFGAWERKTKEEFIPENPQLWQAWEDDPGTARAGGTGETGMEVITRVDDFFKELLATRPGGNYLVAAHNGVNRLYLAYKLGMPLRNYRRILQENSSVTLFTLNEKGDFLLERLNAKW
ncbi:histidine phosphatase family protein [Flavitalea sp. BT771]|uniref:histidine phosphatase family protein n=1 Tax=Flavitalea sp. BT771 TaxID=3063329 RepID=UPI0026E19EFE|nr:histidine phosphatase family protein [Flavitalea sp. BT771]MDO6434906.1 histidine phosphatase family protein [Flavitalea sp. BT771]MDV6223806.1 histidine phosphatase family protein [Flavitalea sp. BT771]